MLSAIPASSQMTALGPQQTDPNSRETQNGLDRRVTLNLTNVTVAEALNAITGQTGVNVTYAGRLVARLPRVTIQGTGIRIREALDRILQGTNLAVVSVEGRLTLIEQTVKAGDGKQNTASIMGRIIDSATRKGIEGVSVTLSETRATTVTNNEGRFVLRNVPPGKQTVEAKLFGYRSGSTSTTVSSEQSVSVTIVLTALPTTLTEVVTTVTGTQRRVELGNSITSLNVDSIVRNTAVNTLTDVIDAGRIPGLVVTRASGAPGAPARVRIRGVSSINATTDPIIIVDGVRVYSDQTNTSANTQYSVLDRIDLNSIETLDVFKGPSAAAMYGSDAANGVIVINTKRGASGPARWNLSIRQQRTTQPGRFPDLYYREGTPLSGGRPIHCLLGQECTNDTVYMFNPLSSSGTTVLGAGHRQAYTASVSGGSNTIQYSVTGSYGDETGLLQLPDADVETLASQTGRSIPQWLRRPQSSRDVSAMGRVDIQMTPAFRAGFTTSLSSNVRRTTPLSRVLGVYSTGGPGDTSVITGSIPNFREQQTYPEQSLRNALNGTWSGQPWLIVNSNIGYDAALRTTEELLRRGDCMLRCGSANYLSLGTYDKRQTWLTVASVNLNANANLPSVFGIRLMPNAGFDYRTTGTSESRTSASGLIWGATSSRGADTIEGDESRLRNTLAGFFLGTRVAVLDRIYTGFGMRFDASNALGARVRPSYPKLDLSYLMSEEPWVPDIISQLRLRMAFGHAAVQPELGVQSRTYVQEVTAIDGVSGTVLRPLTAGNPSLRPERSTEFEGGFDLSAIRDRVSLSVTVYNKLTKDAFTSFGLPLSLNGLQYTVNLGSVRNRGVETQFDLRVLDGPTANWAIDLAISRNTNRLESLAPGMDRFVSGNERHPEFFAPRNVVGYPVHGIWIKPMVTYEDRDGDGVLVQEEILRSDSSVFVGAPYPNYNFSLGSNLNFWQGRLTISGRMEYQNGLTQVNEAALGNLSGRRGDDAYTDLTPSQTLRGLNDPTLSIPEQALVRSGHAFLSTVSTLRLSSVAISTVVPPRIVSLFRARTMKISLQGSNLGLWTNYSGIDPNVNNSIQGNSITDSGNLPMPRTWGLNVSIGY